VVIMLKDSIEGLDNVFESDIPRGHVVMVAGSPGGLKSGFIHNLFANYLTANPDEFGVYLTLEETTESHIRNMKSLKIDLPDNLLISDYSDIRTRFENQEN